MDNHCNSSLVYTLKSLDSFSVICTWLNHTLVKSCVLLLLCICLLMTECGWSEINSDSLTLNSWPPELWQALVAASGPCYISLSSPPSPPSCSGNYSYFFLQAPSTFSNPHSQLMSVPPISLTTRSNRKRTSRSSIISGNLTIVGVAKGQAPRVLPRYGWNCLCFWLKPIFYSHTRCHPLLSTFHTYLQFSPFSRVTYIRIQTLCFSPVLWRKMKICLLLPLPP